MILGQETVTDMITQERLTIMSDNQQTSSSIEVTETPTKEIRTTNSTKRITSTEN